MPGQRANLAVGRSVLLHRYIVFTAPTAGRMWMSHIGASIAVPLEAGASVNAASFA